MPDEIILGNTPVVPEGKDYIVAVSQKASTAYVKQVAANLDAVKLDKSVYDAKMALIDAALGEGDGNLGGRVTTLEGQVATINGSGEGSITAAVAAEASIARAAEEALAGRLDVIEGSGAGSIAAAVAAEESRAMGIEGGLRTDVDAANAAIAVINGTAETSGSIAKALADANSYTDGQISTVNTAVNGKVDKVANHSLVSDTEITKLAGLDDMTTLQGKIDAKANASEMTAALALKANEADVTASLALKANAADVYTKTEVDGKIASVFHYKGTQDSVESLPAENNAIGDVWHVAAAGTNGSGAEYVWTGTAWEELGTAVDLSGYYTSAQADSAIAAAVLVEENRAKGVEGGLDSRLTTAEGDIDALEGRMTTAEGDIDALEGRMATAESDIDGVQAALGTLTAAGSVETAISNAQSAAVTTAGTNADSKIAALTINSKAFSNNAVVVDGGDIALGASYVPGNDDVVALTSASTVSGAFDAIVEHLNTLDELTGGAVDDLSGLNQQVSAIEAALPIADFGGNNTVSAALATKVDKVTGSSLVADTEISKLALYPAYSTVEAAIDSKVTAVEGSQLIESTKVAKLDALPTNAQLNELLAAKVDKQPVVAGASVAMEAGSRYVVTSDFAGTLPANAANGAIVEIYVLVGGAGRTVSAPAGETILGQNLPCAIGISEEGWQLDNEVYTFIKNGTNWHVC